MLGTGGERTVFPLASRRDRSVPAARRHGPTFAPGAFCRRRLFAGVGTIAFGTYDSPNYENAAQVIPAGRRREPASPAVQSVNKVQFTLFVPAGTAPAGGWPVAIFGHGFTDSKNGAPSAVAGTLARNGIATIAINVVGHGVGPPARTRSTATAAPAVVAAGRRPRHRPGRQRHDRLDRGRRAPSARSR